MKEIDWAPSTLTDADRVQIEGLAAIQARRGGWSHSNPKGPCEICGRVRKLYPDHDHLTGALRGQLCFVCNCRGLGSFGDDPKVLRGLVAYLRRYYPDLFDSELKANESPGGHDA